MAFTAASQHGVLGHGLVAGSSHRRQLGLMQAGMKNKHGHSHA
jgi:hypothetical protein